MLFHFSDVVNHLELRLVAQRVLVFRFFWLRFHLLSLLAVRNFVFEFFQTLSILSGVIDNFLRQSNTLSQINTIASTDLSGLYFIFHLQLVFFQVAIRAHVDDSRYLFRHLGHFVKVGRKQAVRVDLFV